jgi:hypothetical protein
MVRFYFILFKYRDLHLIDAHTGEFTRAGDAFREASIGLPSARRSHPEALSIACAGQANRGVLKGIVRRRFVMLLPSLPHRRRDLLYLPQ